MKKLSFVSFFIIVLISVVIAGISNISFTLFIKRTILYFAVIFIGIKILEKSILDTFQRNTHSDNNHTHNTEQKIAKDEDFIPLDFMEIGQAIDGKNNRIKKNPGGVSR